MQPETKAKVLLLIQIGRLYKTKNTGAKTSRAKVNLFETFMIVNYLNSTLKSQGKR